MQKESDMLVLYWFNKKIDDQGKYNTSYSSVLSKNVDWYQYVLIFLI